MSYLRSKPAGGLVFAALSLQVPDSEALSASGPLYWTGAAQESTPDNGSVPRKATVTAWLYQPLESGSRSGFASTLGGVASYLSSNPVPLLFPALSVQLPETDVWSVSGPL